MTRHDVIGWRAASLALALATVGFAISCGDDSVPVLERPVGEAQVLEDGRITLTGCPADQPIDTRESYAIEVPTGSCSASDTVCNVRTQQWCPGGTPGPLLQWACTCVEGAWSCAIGENGGELCPLWPSVTPEHETKPCAYDPARYQAVACQAGAPDCEVTTIAQCPNGSQGRTSHWWCDCETYPTLAPGDHVWACRRLSADGRACGVNTCPTITSYSVNRSRAARGERIELRASARDDEGDDISYRWTATLGRLVNPTVRNTSYTCSAAGKVALSVKGSDGSCEDSAEIEIECTP